MVSLRLLTLFAAVGIGGLIDAPVQILLRRAGRVDLADALQIRLCRLLCRLLRLEVASRGDLPVGRALVVANHVSWTDILVLGSLAPLCFLAKDEVARWPVVGWAARAHGTLFVSRRRTRKILDVNRAMAARIAQGRPVVLFAEGTTGSGSRLLPFRSGHLGAVQDFFALSPRVDTLPLASVALAYVSRRGLRAGIAERTTLAWPGDVPLVPHAKALLRHGPVRCEVRWGEPVDVRRGADRKRLMRTVRLRLRAEIAQMIAGDAESLGNPVKSRTTAILSPGPMAHRPQDPVPRPFVGSAP